MLLRVKNTFIDTTKILLCEMDTYIITISLSGAMETYDIVFESEDDCIEEFNKICKKLSVVDIDKVKTKKSSTTADDKALYTFNVECDNNYYVRAEKENYFTKEVSVSIPDENGSTDLPIALETSVKKVKVGDDLAKFLEIPIIYFDLDKSNIRPDAALELSKVLDVLQQSPKMKIDIRSHTDSRASSKYNESLSERRAKSTMKWLIDNGISADRLTSKGYGESRLINKCADGVECTEAEHQLNRRSEFIIMSLN